MSLDTQKSAEYYYFPYDKLFNSLQKYGFPPKVGKTNISEAKSPLGTKKAVGCRQEAIG